MSNKVIQFGEVRKLAAKRGFQLTKFGDRYYVRIFKQGEAEMVVRCATLANAARVIKGRTMNEMLALR